MLRVYSTVLSDDLEVSQEGTFELPSRLYTTADLKRIIREVNRAVRDADREQLMESFEEE